MKKKIKTFTTLLFSLITSTIQFGVYYGGDIEKPLTNSSTNQIIIKDDQNSCKCNLNYKICDTHCCCDSDCTEEIKKTWRDSNLCLEFEIIDKIERFKCSGYGLYLNRMIKKNYTIESKEIEVKERE